MGFARVFSGFLGLCRVLSGFLGLSEGFLGFLKVPAVDGCHIKSTNLFIHRAGGFWPLQKWSDSNHISSRIGHPHINRHGFTDMMVAKSRNRARE